MTKCSWCSRPYPCPVACYVRGCGYVHLCPLCLARYRKSIYPPGREPIPPVGGLLAVPRAEEEKE